MLQIEDYFQFLEIEDAFLICLIPFNLDAEADQKLLGNHLGRTRREQGFREEWLRAKTCWLCLCAGHDV